jgi:uncharacterized membrane protein YhhN
MKDKTTGLIVAGLGAAVAGAGLLMRRGRIKDGVVGFGLAHIVLGALDMIRSE